MAKKFDFFELNIEGLDSFFNYLLSYSKAFQGKAKRILGGFNTKNVNRKIRKIVKTAMMDSDEFKIKMNKKFNSFVLGAYSMRQISKSSTEKSFKLINKFDMAGADQQIIKTHKGNSWHFSTKSMFSVMLNGRKEYTIPKNGGRQKMSWIAQKGKYVGQYITKRGPLTIPAFGGLDFQGQIESAVEQWFEKIQEKFLNLK